ncbi:MAG TPA: YceI family protein [Bacteroidia bacterium]|nr:YceI family protein [Bacteroidia bacterium]
MIPKISMSFIAAAAITAFAFTAPLKKAAKTYIVDTKTTTATWVGKKVTGQHTGTISISKGTIMTDGTNITGGNFEFDMNSITCTDLTDKGYNDKLIGHLKSDDFFGVEKYPTASFVITKATLKSGNDYDVTGNLTIKGKTNEITFPAKIKMDDKVVVTVAKIMVNRTKFDIKYGSASFFDSIGDKAINDEFELDVNVVANAK